MSDLRWPTYAPRNLCLEATIADVRGGLHVQAADGRQYLDAVGGIGCHPIGHAHPKWVSAIHQQLERLSSSANTFWTRPQQQLAKRLVELFPIEEGRVFFCNSGTEATEAALKLTLRATGRDTIIAFEGAFHGRTLGAIALTANRDYRLPYVACNEDDNTATFARAKVIRLPYNDLAAVQSAFARDGERIAAVFVEPIQGEAGIYPATRQFLIGLREACTRHGALLCADEIQSGMGRTGNWAAWTSIVGADEALQPDVLWLAKALGGGFPIGACIARGNLAAHMAKGTHGTTFGGNPLACVAALATIDVMTDEGLLEQAAAQLPLLQSIALRQPLARVREIRGLGAMLGIEISGASSPALPLAAAMQEMGVLVTVCAGKTVRLLFPYRAGEQELATVWTALQRALMSAAGGE